MDGLTFQSLGAAVGAVAAIWIFATQIPNIIKAIKGDKAGDNGEFGDEYKSILENNTMALVELTQFLKTQSAVDKEKEKHSAQQLNDISAKVDKVIELVTTHSIKCDSQCRQ